MKKILVLVAISLLSIMPAKANEITSVVTKYRQMTLEPLRNSIIQQLMTDYYVSVGLENKDLQSLQSNADQSALLNLAQARMATLENLTQVIISLGGEATPTELERIVIEDNALMAANEILR